MASPLENLIAPEGATFLRTAILKDLNAKCSRNPRYSMRRYAQALGVSHALLSLVMSGKRSPSRPFALQTANLLQLKAEEVLRFFPQGQESIQSAETVSAPIDDGFIKMSLEDYASISDWYYFAILSLLDIRGAKWNSKWISARLGIPEAQALTAMKILAHHKIAEKNSKGRWRQSSKPIKVDNEHSTELTRRVHRNLLQKAAEALEMEKVESRDFSYCTFAMEEKLIPYAKQEIRKFRRGLMRKLEAKGKSDRVYEFCIQLFPVSRAETTLNSKREEK